MESNSDAIKMTGNSVAVLRRLASITCGDICDTYEISPPVNTNTACLGVCAVCNIAMLVRDNEYSCSSCGLTTACDRHDTDDGSVMVSTSLKMGSSSSHNRVYNVSTGDNSAAQLKENIQLFAKLASTWRGDAFAQTVLTTAAVQYAHIQSLIIDIAKNKHVVHRRSIKSEILAALIYYESAKVGIPRRRAECAQFTELTVDGFSRGEKEIRSLYINGLLDITEIGDGFEGHVNRYLLRLNIKTERYVEFISAIIIKACKKNVGTSCQMSSKVAGVVWLVIRHEMLMIRDYELEKVTGNIRKGTFIKFYKAVMHRIGMFANIFLKYNILF